MRNHVPPPLSESRSLAPLKGASALLLALAVLLTAGSARAQAPTNNADPKLRYTADLYGNFALIGNTLGQDCRGTTPRPLNGKMPPNDFVYGERSCSGRDTSPDFFWTLDDWTLENTGASTRPYLPPSGSPIAANPLHARSQAVLTLPPGARVAYARIYWAATRFNSSAGDKIAAPDLTATVSRSGVAGFERFLTADDYAFQQDPGSEYQYQSTADITELVKTYGSGVYQVSDVQAIPFDTTTGEYLFDAWWMVVFYEEPGSISKRHLKLFDSMRVVAGTPGTTISLTGFHVPTYAQDAKLGVIAFEGDDPAPDINDTFEFNGTLLSNDLNPPNNFFNSTRSWTTNRTGVRTDTPLTGVPTGPDGVLDTLPISHRYDRPQLTGTPGSMSGMDLDVVDVTVAAGAKTATVKVNTSGDKFWLGGFITSITTQAPDFTNTIKSVRNITRSDGTVRPGDILEYTIATRNVGDDHSRDTVLTDKLPTQLDYVPESIQILTVAASDTATPGPRTDATGDDTAFYDPGTHSITVYLGTGATSSAGGTIRGIVAPGDVGESTSISFRMQVKTTTTGEVDNQAFITAGGLLGIDPVTTPSSSPAGSGPTRIEVAIVPRPVITAPANGSLTNDNTPTYTGTALPGTTVTVTNSSGTVLCTATTDSAGNWSCTGATPLGEGSHTVTAVATNGAGVPSQPVSTTFRVDTVAPNPPVITAPASGAVLTIQRPLFTGTAEPNATVIVSVDGKVIGRVVADSSGNWSFPAPDPLADGPHTVSATAKDAAGNTSSAASVPFSVTTNPPDTRILTVTPPDAETRSTTISFTFDALGRGDVGGYDCSLDGRTFVPCTSPKNYTDLTDGWHTFAVRARTYSGVVDPTPATYTWFIGLDTDKDGIADSIETATGTDPNDDDSDDDGILDGNEDANRDGYVDPGETDPRNKDTDNDGIQDGTEKGLTAPQGTGTNASVFQPDLDPATTTDPLDSDTDDGSVSDGVEDANNNGRIDPGERNPNDPADDKTVAADTDGDGIPDAVETATGTDPNDDDSDDDGILDGNEDLDHDGVVDPGETNPRNRDSDNDGLQDGTEKGLTAPQGSGTSASVFQPDTDPATTTNPLDDDSDDDGLLDGNEDADHDGAVDATETNPNNRDTDGDGIQDGTEKGLATPQGTGTNLAVFIPDADPVTKTDPLKVDTDNGGVSDGLEDTNHNGRVDLGERNPLDPADDSVVTDTDGDGIPDAVETANGTDPNDDDTDDDGILDGNEDLDHDGVVDPGETNPRNSDSDNDGLQDGTEKGLIAPQGSDTSASVFQPDTDPATTTNPLDDDSDDDGLLDGTEDADHDGAVDATETDPKKPDTDGDGLQDGTEKGLSSPEGLGTNLAVFIPDANPLTRTDPLKADTDNGGVSDGVEDTNHNGRVDPGERNPLDPADDLDTDRDGIPDAVETANGTDPNDDDTDDDGILDGNEDTNRNGVVDPGETNPRNRDTDNDGLQDGTEKGLTAPQGTGTNASIFQPDTDTNTTNPLDDDSDDDGILDGTEDADHDGAVDTTETDPNKLDTDGDGLQDGTEKGLSSPEGLGTNLAVFIPDADPLTKTDPLKVDTDNGGVSDGVEDTNRNGRVDPGERNPLNPTDDLDTDGDGIPDTVETATGTDPAKADTDGDGIPDGVEDKNHNGVVDPGETDPRKADSDNDGLPDGIEDKNHNGVVDPGETNPTNPDTDGGGVLDGVEDKNHNGVVDPGETDPLDPSDDAASRDSDGDGVPDATELELGLDPNDSDSDDDGVPDGQDGITDTDHDGIIDALDPDSDNDGIKDGTELGVTRANAPAGTNLDSPNFVPDEDPSTTTDPKKADTDGDGLKDGQEDKNANGRVDSGETDPNDTDTDKGGLSDGDEVKFNTNPLDDTDDFIIAGRGCSTSGSGSPLVWLAALVLLAMPVLRRTSRRGTALAGGLLGLVGVLAAPAADAQGPTPSPLSQSIDVQRYKPGPGATDILGVHGARVDGHLGWHLAASLNYASNPLGFLDPRQDDFIYSIVANQVTVDLMGSISLWDRFELGVALPITYQSSESGAPVTPAFQNGVSGAGLGDLRLVPKAHLLTAGGFDLGVVVPVLLPSAGGNGFRGGAGVSARPQLVGEWGNGEGLRLVANLGANLQPEQQVRNLRTGTELMFAVGAQVPLTEKLAVRANLAGAFGLNDQDMEGRPLELLAAVQYRFSPGLAAHVGGGPGLSRGYGTPGFRLFAGLDWTQPGERAPAAPAAPPAPVDSDNDGVTDDKDQCAQGPEDMDGFQDDDGCADPDNDGDGILDTNDKCPNEPETVNGFQDEDGCPDKAPVDTDKDGLMDDEDKCPTQPEDKDGFQDEDGCPDPDNDKDGIPDWEDQCPMQPETINGVKDEDGCPDEGKSKVRLEAKRIVILDKVYFATNKDVILPKSFDLLNQVASVLRANPQIELLRVEGHTDNQGKPAKNQNLSERRAANVRAFLIKEGVAAGRLESVGYGQTKPVDTNKTAAGRENNRRVEFNILKVAGEEAEQPK